MGAVYFNGNSSSNSVFYRIKPIPSLNITQGLGSLQNSLPLFRSGQDRLFRIQSKTQILLIGSTGTVISTINSGTIISGGFFSKVYLDSTDQCLYVLVCNGASTQYQLIKIDDTTGGITNLGTTVSPASPSNWGFGSGSATEFGFLDKPESTTLRVIYDGYLHTISKVDGTIISEGTSMVLGGYSPRGCTYINNDGDIGADFFLGQTTDYDGMNLPTVVSVGCGKVAGNSANAKIAPYTVFTTKAEGSQLGVVAVDNDKLAFLNLDSTLTLPCKLFYRADWDRFLRSVVDYHAGLV